MRKLIRKIIIIPFVAALLILGAGPAMASTTFLPVVQVPVICVTNGTHAVFQGWFTRYDSDGTRSPYRGGFKTTDGRWNIHQIQVIGNVNDRSYSAGPITFASGQHAASEYVPVIAPYASRPNVSISIYVVFTDGKSCVGTLESN